jgi:hypothetical protein
MAKSSGSSLMTLGLLGVAGYFVYENFFAAPATATAASGAAPAGTTPADTSATAPASLRRARTLSSAACASLETEGRGFAAGLRLAEPSFLENNPISLISYLLKRTSNR